MTGNSDGEFRDENDFRKFLQHAMDNAEGWAASSWSNPFKHDRIVEAMAQIVRTCVQLFNRGFQSFCQKSIQVNDTLKEFAKKEDEFKWGWWRKGEPLKHDDGTWVGNDAPSLVETVYLEGSGIIKHDYLTIPDPIQLDTVVFEQNGVEALMGVATAGQLDSICSVPWMDPKMTSSEFGASVLDNSIDANRWQRLVDHVRIEEIREFAEGQETNLFNPSAWLWGSWIDDALENRVTFSEDNIIIQKLSGGQVIQEDNLNNLYYGNFSITEVYDWGEDVVAAPWFLDTGYTVSVKNVQDVYAFIGDFTSNSSPNNPASGNAIIWRNTYWDWLGAAVPNEESFEIILTKEL